jgi:hypothetical protein
MEILNFVTVWARKVLPGKSVPLFPKEGLGEIKGLCEHPI